MKFKLRYLFITLGLMFTLLLNSCKSDIKETSTTITTTQNIYATLDVTALNEEIDVSVELSDDFKVFYNTYNLEIFKGETEVGNKKLSVSQKSFTFENLSQNTNYLIKLVASDIVYDSVDVTTLNDTKGTFKFEDDTVSYDGKYHSLYVTSDLDSSKYSVEYLSNSCLNPGVYKIVATIKEIGFKEINMTATLTISKGKISKVYDMTDKEFDYSGNYYVPDCNYDNVAITYTDESGEIYTKIKDAGVYTASFNFAGDDFYEEEKGSWTVKINKIDLTCDVTSFSILQSDVSHFMIDEKSFNLSDVDFTLTYYLNGNVVSNISKAGDYTFTIYSAETKNHTLFYKAYNLTVLSKEYAGLYIQSIYYKDNTLIINIANLLDYEYDLSQSYFSLDNVMYRLSSKLKSQDIFTIVCGKDLTIACDYYINASPENKTLKIWENSYVLNENLYLRGDIYTGEDRLVLKDFVDIDFNIFSKMKIYEDALSVLTDLKEISVSDISSFKVENPSNDYFNIDTSNITEENIGTSQKIIITYGNMIFFVSVNVKL